MFSMSPFPSLEAGIALFCMFHDCTHAVLTNICSFHLYLFFAVTVHKVTAGYYLDCKSVKADIESFFFIMH